MALARVWIPSPNYSAGRSQNRLLVVHTAQGARTYQDLGAFFGNPGREVSSQVGIDDTADVIGEYVKPQNKAWAAFKANDWGEHAELCGFAEWTRPTWLAHRVMLANCGKWLVEESVRYKIPLVKIGAAEIRAGRSGVCGHKDLTDAGAGGDHWDPGPAFPWDVVLAGSPLPTKGAPGMPNGAVVKATKSGKGYWVVDADGGVFTYGDAGFYGSVPQVLKPGQTLSAPIVSFDVQPNEDGYLMLGQDNGIFAFGSAKYLGHPGA